jgi:hypothetical protein
MHSFLKRLACGRPALLLVVASLIAGCSGGAGNPITAGVAATPFGGMHAGGGVLQDLKTAAAFPQAVAPNERAVPGAHGASWLSPMAKVGKNVLYWGDFNTNSITIFPSKGINPKPIGQITTGLSNPERLFVDKNLNLYATNLGNGTVVAYKPGTTSPSLTISSGVSSPTGLVVGADGKVYCANVGNDTVTEYPKGKTAPSLTLAMGALSPENLAVDHANNLYVSYLGGPRGSGVMEFASGSTTGTDLGLNVGTAGAIEVDLSGNIILVDASVPSIDVFPAGQTNPSKKIPSPAGSPFELSLSKSETMLYASIDNASAKFIIQDIAYPNGTTLKNKINNAVDQWPVAVSPDNAL